MGKYLRINYGDWLEDALREERPITTEEELIAYAMEAGAREAAQRAIASREAKLAPADILPENKALLSGGGAAQIHVMLGLMREICKLPNGREVMARTHTATVVEEEDENEDETTFRATAVTRDNGGTEIVKPYTKLGTPESCENARRYLRRRVLGHVRNRFVEIAAGGGDVLVEGGVLIDSIQEMMEEYS